MNEPKQRHGCLTAHLILLALGSLGGIALYLFASDWIFSHYPDAPDWTRWAPIVIGLWQLICVGALFMWKKWGFYGMCAGAAGTFLFNGSMGLGLGQSWQGFIGVAVLYAVLRTGGKSDGWAQLE